MNDNSKRILDDAARKLRYVWSVEKQLKEAKRVYQDTMSIFASSLASEYGLMVADVIQDDACAYDPITVNRFEAVDMRGESSDPLKQWLVWAIGDNDERIPINGRYKINLISRPK